EGSPLTLSAFARLLATVLRRTDSAARPEPATSKILNEDICVVPLESRSGDRGHEIAKARRDEGERRLVANGVVRERGLLELRIDGIPVERRRERNAVFERRGAIRTRCRADVAGGGRCELYGRPCTARGSSGSGERRLKVDIARLVVRRIDVRQVVGEHLHAARLQLQRLRLDAEVRIQIEQRWHWIGVKDSTRRGHSNTHARGGWSARRPSQRVQGVTRLPSRRQNIAAAAASRASAGSPGVWPAACNGRAHSKRSDDEPTHAHPTPRL